MHTASGLFFTELTIPDDSAPSVPPSGSLQAVREAARDALELASYDDPDLPLSTTPARRSNWRSLEDRDVVRQEARRQVTAARLKADKALQGEDWEGCERALGDALKLDTHNPGLYLSRAYVRLKQGRTTRSLQDSGKAISLDPRSPRGYHRYARSLCQEKRFAEAGSSFVQGLGVDSHYEPAQRRCDVVLEAIRRERHYYPGPSRSRETSRVLASPAGRTSNPWYPSCDDMYLG